MIFLSRWLASLGITLYTRGMKDLRPGTRKLHVCVQLDEEVIQGEFSKQTAVFYRPLCTPCEVLTRRDTFTPAHQGKTKYYYEPLGHLVWEPKETGTLACYEFERSLIRSRELPSAAILERCEECLHEFDEKYILLVLAETEL